MFLAQVIGPRQGGEGFAGNLVIALITRIIQDQMSEFSSTGISVCNLTNKIFNSVNIAATEIILAS